MIRRTVGGTDKEESSRHSNPNKQALSDFWAWLWKYFRVYFLGLLGSLWWIIIVVFLLITVLGLILAPGEPAIDVQYYPLRNYELKVTYPERIYRSNNLHPGQSISLEVVDLPSTYLSKMLYITIDPGSPFLIVDKDGFPIPERLQIYPQEETKGLFLRLRNENDSQEYIWLEGRIFQGKGISFSEGYNLVLENARMESKHEYAVRRLTNLILDPSWTPISILLAFVSWIVKEARDRYAERKAREKEQHENWMRDLETISAGVETDPIGSLAALTDLEKRISVSNINKNSQQTEDQVQLNKKRVQISKKLADKYEDLLYEAGEMLRIGNRTDCVELLDKLKQALYPPGNSGLTPETGERNTTHNETSSHSLILILPDLIRKSPTDSPETARDTISKAFFLHHQFPWGGREVAISLLQDAHLNDRLLQDWVETANNPEKESTASLMHDVRLQSLVGTHTIHHNYPLPSVPNTTDVDDKILAFYKSMGFKENPFYPYFPDYDKEVLQQAESSQPYIITDPSWFHREGAIRAITNQYVQSSTRHGLILYVPLLTVPAGTSASAFQNMVTISKEHTDTWLKIIAKTPILFIDQSISSQTRLVELFLFSYGTIPMVLNRLIATGFEESRSAGKSLVRRLKKLGGDLSRPPHPPTHQQMFDWLEVRPPDLSRTFLHVSTGRANLSTLNSLEWRQVIAWASMAELLLTHQVILKLWMPPHRDEDWSTRISLPTHALCWKTKHLEDLLRNRFERCSKDIPRTFDALFESVFEVPDENHHEYQEYFGKQLIRYSQGSIERMLRMGDDLVRRHVAAHGSNAPFMTLEDMERHIQRWEQII